MRNPKSMAQPKEKGVRIVSIQTNIHLVTVIENNLLEETVSKAKETKTAEEHLLRDGAPYRFLRPLLRSP